MESNSLIDSCTVLQDTSQLSSVGGFGLKMGVRIRVRGPPDAALAGGSKVQVTMFNPALVT